MSVLIAIPSYDRAHLLEHCIRCAVEMQSASSMSVMIFDDCSRTLDIHRMVGNSPVDVSRSDRNLGASGTICRIWRHFLTSPHEFLLMLDSDLVANRRAVDVGLKHHGEQRGLLSLYNSIMHPGVYAGPDLLRKQRLGNAGTFWNRELAELCLTELEGQDAIDDRYSELLNARGVPMFSVVQSRVQHLGVKGQNNDIFGYLEHGQNFRPDGEAQVAAILETYDRLMSDQHAFRRPSLKRRIAHLMGAFARTNAVEV